MTNEFTSVKKIIAILANLDKLLYLLKYRFGSLVIKKKKYNKFSL